MLYLTADLPITCRSIGGRYSVYLGWTLWWMPALEVSLEHLVILKYLLLDVFVSFPSMQVFFQFSLDYIFDNFWLSTSWMTMFLNFLLIWLVDEVDEAAWVTRSYNEPAILKTYRFRKNADYCCLSAVGLNVLTIKSCYIESFRLFSHFLPYYSLNQTSFRPCP